MSRRSKNKKDRKNAILRQVEIIKKDYREISDEALEKNVRERFNTVKELYRTLASHTGEAALRIKSEISAQRKTAPLYEDLIELSRRQEKEPEELLTISLSSLRRYSGKKK